MMKTVILCSLIGALLTVPSLAARKKEKPWPPFQVGVTGIMAAPTEGTVIPLTVAEVTPDTPAAGKLQVGDVLVAVNGVKLAVADQLNQALANFGDPELAEGKKGANVLAILSGENSGAPGLLYRHGLGSAACHAFAVPHACCGHHQWSQKNKYTQTIWPESTMSATGR
jgi:hypothetical protein